MGRGEFGRGSRSFGSGNGRRFGSSRGGRGGGGSNANFSQAFQGPPNTVTPMGEFVHECEGEAVCRSINPKIPYFNAPIYLENKTQIGKVDEILGPINEVYFTIKLQEGIIASSFKPADKFYIADDKLLPLDRFLPKPPVVRDKASKKQGDRGGRGSGGFRGGGGGSRGNFRRGGGGGFRGRGAGGFRGRR
ncbi:1650_t:CDS:2 [Ambispora leptoticha]|uniref:H/ACA ribonucleoprotein complex subunit n=1 Tax=Ambispora leptoticha TaxID=144679 RepID=A0A9N8ZH38_9GLOM|nr:1650_t:CDS:2 [Ambispora leptoticha]